MLRLGALAACAILAAAGAQKAQARDLTFDERVAAQAAIEQVYWNHRIWPEGNRGPKPRLAAVLPEAGMGAKVARALRLSMLLDAARRQPLAGADLQEEIDRMVAGTKAPDTLRELFAALNDDPFLIAECLARPALVARLADAADLRGADGGGAGDLDRATITPPAAGYAIPSFPSGGCTDDSWQVSSLTNGTGARVPSARQLHTTVWTGSELIVWGGWDGASVAYRDGGVYDPATDSWALSSLSNGAGTNVPAARFRHTAVWTGTEMIVWGGRNAAGTPLNTGGRYDPAADSWISSSLTNASGTNVPTARQFHTAVWTGSAMIVWGGAADDASNAVNTGGVFDPLTDGWTTGSVLINGVGAFTPAARIDHTAVWTGSEMIVWGGRDSSGADLDNGGIFDPAANAWISSLPLNNGSGTNVPSARHFHTAVWSGTEMIVWGGASGASGASLNTGGRYSRSADAWLISSLKNGTGTRVPTARQLHTAIWNGGEMIVWGGSTDGSSGVLNTGGRFSPATDGWAVTSLTNGTGTRVPTARQLHTAVWTGTEMIVWGGSSNATTGVANTGGLFCAVCPIVVWHLDADGDGYGGSGATVSACAQPAGYAASSNDCDDGNPAVHPGATEVCDGLDNDCDTLVDNGGGALCTDGDVCSADVCNAAAGCQATHPTANLDVTGFSATRVDGRDLVILADAWNTCSGDPAFNAAADFDQNACVDLTDFHVFMSSFGQSCP
jgi:hypothetical protein